MGGNPGTSGGSSISLISLDATVQLNECSLITSQGGKGGNGATGQTGQPGGDGGIGGLSSGFGTSLAGCNRVGKFKRTAIQILQSILFVNWFWVVDC